MQIIEYSECLCMVAKDYYEFLYNDKYLYEMSVTYIKNKQYYMSNGVKEKCINLIEESWRNVNNSDSFYQYLLVNVSCNEIMIESVCNMFVDMLMYLQDIVRR